MGQYHIPVNITRKEFFSPHGLASGLKQWEQANISAWTEQGTIAKPTMRYEISTWAVVPIALYASVCTSINRGGGDFDDHPWLGRWAGGIVIVAGDYGERGDIRSRSGVSDGMQDDCDLYYSACCTTDEDWTQTLVAASEMEDPTVYERLKRLGKFTDVTLLVQDWYLKEFGMAFEGEGWNELKYVGRPIVTA